MEKKQKIQIARMAIEKNLDFETLMYCDDMYGKEDHTEDVWEYVVEAREQGTNWFYETYQKELKS